MNLKQPKFAQHLKQLVGQKFTWFALVVVSLTITAFSTQHEESPFTEEATAEEAVTLTQVNNTAPSVSEFDTTTLPEVTRVEASFSEEVAPVSITRFFEPRATSNNSSEAAEELISYAQSLMGTQYVYGGITEDGFDCSGFVYHVFSKFDYDIERSSRAQSTQGEEIVVEEAQPGDLLFFTGTNPKIRKVGHVGIVISAPGEPVTFVHSSSNGGVKVSELEGYYTTRFMSLKRMM